MYRFVDGEYQRDDAVAAVSRYQRVGICAAFGVQGTVEQVVCSLAHRMTNRIFNNRYHAYVAHVRAII